MCKMTSGTRVSLTADLGQGNCIKLTGGASRATMPIAHLRWRVLKTPTIAMALAAQAAVQAGGLIGTGAAPRIVAQRACSRGLQGVGEGKLATKQGIAAAVQSRPTVTARTTMHAAATTPSSPVVQESTQSHGAHEADLTAVELQEPVVTVHWLNENLHCENIKVVDASWYMPAEMRNPRSEFEASHIPGALFFDLDKVVDLSSNLPHMLPSEDAFAAAVSALGIRNKDLVVVYDGRGIFSAARVWWMFRAFGHEKVVVLDGGLPQWRDAGYKIESGLAPKILENIEAASAVVRKIHSGESTEKGSLIFEAVLQPDLVWSKKQVKQNLEAGKYRLIDARSKGRFDGTIPEPRAGIRGGHIPGSTCIPFNEVLSGSGTLLPAEELELRFKDAEISTSDPIVASCGTGVTACILALALYRLRQKQVPVYDGSWTEWGMSTDTPVATNELRGS